MYRKLKTPGARATVASRVVAKNRCWWRNSDNLLKTVLTIAYFLTLVVPRRF